MAIYVYYIHICCQSCCVKQMYTTSGQYNLRGALFYFWRLCVVLSLSHVPAELLLSEHENHENHEKKHALCNSWCPAPSDMMRAPKCLHAPRPARCQQVFFIFIIIRGRLKLFVFPFVFKLKPTKRGSPQKKRTPHGQQKARRTFPNVPRIHMST